MAFAIRDFTAGQRRAAQRHADASLGQRRDHVLGRAVKDSNIFFSGAPLLSTNNGRDLDVYPFFDQRKDTLAGPDTTRLQFEIGPGATPSTLSSDFSDGRTIDLKQFGVSFDFNVGEWEITDRLGYLDGTADTRAIFTSAVPLTLGSYINGRIAAVNGSAPVVAAAGGVATADRRATPPVAPLSPT